jgi:uncharacterized coiled-coil protein SlyX
MLEEIRGQNRATIEALQATEQRIRADFDERFRSLEARVCALELAVQLLSKTVAGHSEELRSLSKTVAGHSEELRSVSTTVSGQTEELRLVRQDINGLKAAVERQAEADDLAKLETRIVALEAR